MFEPSNTHSDMVRFANTLEKGVKYRRLAPVLDKYGYRKFKEMYKIWSS